jgi:hypothetical protein
MARAIKIFRCVLLQTIWEKGKKKEEAVQINGGGATKGRLGKYIADRRRVVCVKERRC